MSMQEASAAAGPPPESILWRFPRFSGHTHVILDEDGVQVRFRGEQLCEPGEVPEFIQLLLHALQVSRREHDDLVPVDVSPGELRTLTRDAQDQRILRKAHEALDALAEEVARA